MADRHSTHSYRLTHDLTGQRFGRLYVLAHAGSTDRGKSSKGQWLCRCDCGAEITVITNSLTSSNTRSCGCLYREAHSQNNHAKKHGLWKTPEWQAWSQMRRRCYDTGHISYPRYGGHGVTVCEGWRDSDTFPDFFAALGQRPSPKHSLDRIDNSKNYTCGRCEECRTSGAILNCRWATKAEQAKNRRDTKMFTFQGETLCMSDWAKRFGIAKNALHYRLKVGWSLERALTTPTRPS